MTSGLQLQNGFVNIFKAIPYKVFVSTVSTNKVLLLRAEWSIRKMYPHAVMKTVNTELWIFSLFGKDEMPTPDPQYGLKEISTGVFLSSTLAAGDGFLPAPYNPFIQAIKQLASTSILNSLDKTLPFGPKFYCSDTNSFLHCDVGFSTTGDLTFKLYVEPTALTIAKREVIPPASNANTGIRIHISPTGSTGTLIGLTEPPPDSSQFLSSLTVVSNCENIGDFESPLDWISIKLDSNGKTISWPMKFCLCEPSAISNNLTQDFPCSISSANIWTQIKTRISSIHKIATSKESSENKSTDSAADKVASTEAVFTNKHLTALDSKRGASTLMYPTPPDPQSSHKANEDESMDNNWATPGGNAGNWTEMDDELFGGENEVTEADFNFFDQPEEDDVNPHDEITDSTMVGDVGSAAGVDDILLKAKDQPSNVIDGEDKSFAANADMTKRNKNENSPSISQDISKSRLGPLIRNPKDGLLDVPENESPNKKMKGMFAPINFNTSIREEMDDKYDRGGRFFVPNPDESSEPVSEEDENGSQDSESSYSMDSPALSKATNIGMSASPFSPLVPNVATDKSMGAEHGLEFTPGAPETSPVSVSKIALTAKPKISEFASPVSVEWVNLMTSNSTNVHGGLERSETREVDLPKSLEAALPTLVDQIVWDDGLLENIVKRVPPFEAPPADIIKTIAQIFPAMSQGTLKDFVDMSLPPTPGNNRNSAALPVTSASAAGKLEKQHSASSLPSLVPSSTSGDTKMVDDSFGEPKSLTDSVPSLVRVKSLSTVGDESSSSPDNELVAQQGISASRAPLVEAPRTAGDDFINLPAPLFAFNRMNQLLKARSPILRFWKIFGLQPLSGPKDIDILCIFPDGEGLDVTVKPFFDLLKSIYEDSGLGQLSLLHCDGCKNGVIPVDVSRLDSMDDLSDRMQTAGSSAIKIISGLAAEKQDPSENKHVMLLVVNPIATIESLKIVVEMTANIKEQVDNLISLGLKIIPRDFLFKENSLVLPAQSRVLRIALQAYDLFSYETETTNQHQSILRNFLRNSPSFTLARKPPLKINFRLSETPSHALLEEDTIIHISYAISDDNRWVIASWCDQWGEKFNVEAFNLGRWSNKVQKFEDITSQIWAKTLSLVSCKPIRWKIFVTKAGPMSDYEQKVWLQVFETSVSSQISYCFLLQMDVNFSLILTAKDNVFPAYKQKQAQVNAEPPKDSLHILSQSVNTPGTPQRGSDFDSPDIYGGNTPTPSAAQSGSTPQILQTVTSATAATNTAADKGDGRDCSIVEVEDDTYGLVFRSRTPLPAFTSPDKLRPVIGGILIRPGAYDEVTGQITSHQCLEFTILHSSSPPLLAVKSLLFWYRQLSSLAQYTGVSRHTVVPIHVEAVHKVAQVFNYL